VTDPPLYPGHDVLAKWNTPAWDAITRRVIDELLATPDAPRFFSGEEWAVAAAVRRIVPPDACRSLRYWTRSCLAITAEGFVRRACPICAKRGARRCWHSTKKPARKYDGRGFAELRNHEHDALLLPQPGYS
jgi:hypothetical protein